MVPKSKFSGSLPQSYSKNKNLKHFIETIEQPISLLPPSMRLAAMLLWPVVWSLMGGLLATQVFITRSFLLLAFSLPRGTYKAAVVAVFSADNVRRDTKPSSGIVTIFKWWGATAHPQPHLNCPRMLIQYIRN